MVESTVGLKGLFSHALKWLVNLQRAKEERKQASVAALRKVISASRETAVYVRALNKSGEPNLDKERELSILWTELGFALEDLGMKALAKRCDIKGKHWSNPEHYNSEFLDKADVSLERMEKLARRVLAELNS